MSPRRGVSDGSRTLGAREDLINPPDVQPKVHSVERLLVFRTELLRRFMTLLSADINRRASSLLSFAYIRARTLMTSIVYNPQVG